MQIPPKYQLTKKISLLLSKLEENKGIIDSLFLPIAIEENIRRLSLMGSSLFSARIEGNTLRESDISELRDLTSKDKEKIEVANLVRAISYILKEFVKRKDISIKDILDWHNVVMKNLLIESGSFRKSHEGIFDQVGNLIYHAPPPQQVKKLMQELVNYINDKEEVLTPIKAILSHFILERIHPFVDGSGRIGRLLQLSILVSGGYAMKGIVVVEAEIEKNRSLYYNAIESFNGDATEFIELILEFLVSASDKAREKVLSGQKYNQEDLLPPRRKEILQIINDHKLISLNFLERRFLELKPRLLRYELKKLMDEGYISKIGKTRGALYTISVS